VEFLDERKMSMGKDNNKRKIIEFEKKLAEFIVGKKMFGFAGSKEWIDIKKKLEKTHKEKRIIFKKINFRGLPNIKIVKDILLSRKKEQETAMDFFSIRKFREKNQLDILYFTKDKKFLAVPETLGKYCELNFAIHNESSLSYDEKKGFHFKTPHNIITRISEADQSMFNIIPIVKTDQDENLFHNLLRPVLNKNMPSITMIGNDYFLISIPKNCFVTDVTKSYGAEISKYHQEFFSSRAGRPSTMTKKVRQNLFDKMFPAAFKKRESIIGACRTIAKRFKKEYNYTINPETLRAMCWYSSKYYKKTSGKKKYLSGGKKTHLHKIIDN
jgi:hypothetical protein